MAEKVYRTLTYRRAGWFGTPPAQTLEGLLRVIQERLPTHKARSFDFASHLIEGIAIKDRRGIILGHVTQCTPDALGSLVQHPADTASSDTLEVAPQEGTDFLEGDIMFLVTGDHALFCPSRTRETTFIRFLDLATEKLGLQLFSSMCSLLPVANASKLRVIAAEGVRKIHLRSSLYEATMERPGEGYREHVLRRAAEGMLDLFRESEPLNEVARDENVTVVVELRFNSHKRGGRMGGVRMESVAQQLIQEEDERGADDSFIIETRGGKLITPHEINIKQKQRVEPHGHSVARESAWAALEDFYADLRDEGALAQ